MLLKASEPRAPSSSFCNRLKIAVLVPVLAEEPEVDTLADAEPVTILHECVCHAVVPSRLPQLFSVYPSGPNTASIEAFILSIVKGLESTLFAPSCAAF
jgi:hypothetical protein